jgi:hypothetical protein
VNNEPEAYETPDDADTFDDTDAAPDDPNREGMPDAAPAPRRPREVGAGFTPFPRPLPPPR